MLCAKFNGNLLTVSKL